MVENENDELRKEANSNTNNSNNSSFMELKESCMFEENVVFIQNEHADTMSKLAETTDTLKHQT